MLLQAPLRTAEFLVVDTETNGRPGDACELTEVGAVLVGGGELHDRWESLVAVRAPLSKGIQRFTGVTQAMVDGAPPAEATLPELAALIGSPPTRVLVGHSVSFDRRVLRGAFARAGLAWPDPPALCTVAMARRLAPLAGQRKLAALAGSLGIDVEVSHRALADAETCARVFCALFGRLCAHAATVGDALALLGPSRPRRAAPPRPARRGHRPDLSGLPDAPGVYVFRNAEGQPLYVGKSVRLGARARAHFAPSSASADWTGQAAIVEHQPTHSELGALVLEHRLIRALRPPGNVRGRRRDGLVYLRCRFDVAFPVLEVAHEPAGGHAVNVGPLRGRAAAVELKEQLDSLFGLRHCARRLPRREHPSAYGQMGRCLSPCLGDLDPNLYRRRLDEALALFTGPGDGGAALLARVEEQVRAAAADQAFERAAWLQRRHARLRVVLARLGPVLRAVHTHPRLVLAPGPGGRWDALWLVGGRVADLALAPDPAPGAAELAERTRAVLRGPAGGGGPYLTADGLDELRIVDAWIAARHPPALDLGSAAGAPGVAALERFLRRIDGCSIAA